MIVLVEWGSMCNRLCFFRTGLAEVNFIVWVSWGGCCGEQVANFTMKYKLIEILYLMYSESGDYSREWL